jgi:hypothetical protein
VADADNIDPLFKRPEIVIQAPTYQEAIRQARRIDPDLDKLLSLTARRA